MAPLRFAAALEGEASWRLHLSWYNNFTARPKGQGRWVIMGASPHTPLLTLRMGLRGKMVSVAGRKRKSICRPAS